MLKNYLKIAFRNLKKYKTYSFINIFGLATGITLCLLLLFFVKNELSYDSYHEKSDRIYRIYKDNPDEKIAVTPSLVGPVLGNNLPEIEQWVRIYEPTKFSPAVISYQENLFQENNFFYADSTYFSMFSHTFLEGNPRTALDRPESLVLTKSMAQKIFGNQPALGKVVEGRIFSSVIDFEVTGVIEDVPQNSHFTFDYMGSLNTRSNWSQLNDSELRSSNFYTYLLLNTSNPRQDLPQTMTETLNRYIPEQSALSLEIQRLTDIYLKSDLNYEIRPMSSMANVIGFSALAFLILIIAITNYINLATARSSRRAAEVGIRKVLGATKSTLARQFYGESIIITMFAVIIAVFAVEIFKEPFFNIFEKTIEGSLFSTSFTWILLGVITLLTALFAGSYPAIILSSYQPSKVLKGSISTTGSDATLRKGLVVFQFTISIFLILGSTIVYKQTNFLLNKNLGFEKDQVMILSVNDEILSDKKDFLKQEVLRKPGVVSASYVSNVPGRVFGGYTAEYPPLEERIGTAAGAADKDVVNALGLTLLSGEGFPDNPSYTTDQGYLYLINESLSSSFGWTPEEAIGKEFNVLGNRLGEVKGVVKDFNFASLKENIEPLALFMQPSMYNYLLVKVSPDNIQNTISSIGGFWKDIAPHRPYEYEFMDQEFAALYNREVQTKNIFFLFSILAVIIACLGLVGLSSYTIEQRTKEIGIRKVLGASVTSIVQLLSKDFIKLVLVGFILSIPATWYLMNQWLADFAYKINLGIGLFLFAGITAILIALATVSWQSIKAAHMNPIKSLKSE